MQRRPALGLACFVSAAAGAGADAAAPGFGLAFLLPHVRWRWRRRRFGLLCWLRFAALGVRHLLGVGGGGGFLAGGSGILGLGVVLGLVGLLVFLCLALVLRRRRLGVPGRWRLCLLLGRCQILDLLLLRRRQALGHGEREDSGVEASGNVVEVGGGGQLEDLAEAGVPGVGGGVGALAADGEAAGAVDLHPEILFPEAFLQARN